MAKANESYERGEYAEAAQQYEALVDQGYYDAALYLNLGNAYFESGDLGRAILSYLRAQELSPRDSDIRDNLELAHSMTVDRVPAERDSLVESVSHFVRLWLTPGELGAAALLLWVFERDGHLRARDLACIAIKAGSSRRDRHRDRGYRDVFPVSRDRRVRQPL